MNIIETYLENMFAGLPKTKEVLKMKADLHANMIDKYNELKQNGKTENEAIGIVISEFGNIEELANELGIDINKEAEEEVPVVTSEIANRYMITSKRMGRLIALGVLLCILSPSLLILFNGGFETFNFSTSAKDFFGLVFLFAFVACAVGIFIYSGMKLEKFEYLKKKVIIPKVVKEMVEARKEEFDGKFTIALIIGIIIYIFSPATLIGLSLLNKNYEHYGIIVLLVMVGVATFIIISFSVVRGSHNLLLRINDYSNIDKESNKIINAIAGIYWPIVVGIHLFWSFMYNSWRISWIVYVIAGILFAAISSLIKLIKKDID